MHISSNTFTNVYFVCLDNIMKYGNMSSPRDMTQMELQNFNYTVVDPSMQYLENIGHTRRPNYEYGDAFRDFVMSGKKRVPKSLIELNAIANNFTAESADGFKAYDVPKNFSIFYGPRIAAQLENITNELRNDPDSRRAYISVLDGINDNKLLGDLANNTLSDVEYPCTVGFHFTIRDGKVNCAVQMRSQNALSVWPYDFLIGTSLLKAVAKSLGKQIGNFHGQVSSMHIYERDFEVVGEMLKMYFNR